MITPPNEVLGTKVCDDHGHPLVVYHGTTISFDRFSMEYLLSVGLHFGCREQANWRIKDRDGARIFPVYLNIRELLNLAGDDLGWQTPSNNCVRTNAEGDFDGR